jgi:hypothetical protein
VEDFRLNNMGGGLLTVALAIAPDLATVSTLTDLALKLASLVSVGLIIFLNVKKIRSNAPA